MIETAYVLTTVAPWAAAFGAQRCAGDDLLDELHSLHLPTAVVDAGTGESTGWLELARDARTWSLRLPAPGDPDGITPGEASRAASTAGEALIIETASDTRIVVPHRDPDRAPVWLAYPVASEMPAPMAVGLGEARLMLLDAVGDATASLAALNSASTGDAATLRADLATAVSRYAPVLPPGAHGRAAEVAALAAQVLGTVALAAERRVAFGVAGTHADESDRRLGEVATAARRALGTAVNRVMTEFSRPGP